jgi:hypothetical protein
MNSRVSSFWISFLTLLILSSSTQLSVRNAIAGGASQHNSGGPNGGSSTGYSDTPVLQGSVQAGQCVDGKADMNSKLSQCMRGIDPMKAVMTAFQNRFNCMKATASKWGMGLEALDKDSKARQACDNRQGSWVDSLVNGLMDGLVGLVEFIFKMAPELLWQGITHIPDAAKWATERAGDVFNWGVQSVGNLTKQTVSFLSNPQVVSSKSMAQAQAAGGAGLRAASDPKTYEDAWKSLSTTMGKIFEPLWKEFTNYLGDLSCHKWGMKNTPQNCPVGSAGCSCLDANSGVAEDRALIEQLGNFGVTAQASKNGKSNFCYKKAPAKTCLEPFPGFDAPCWDCEGMMMGLSGMIGQVGSFLVPSAVIRYGAAVVGVASKLGPVAELTMKVSNPVISATTNLSRTKFAQGLGKAGGAVLKGGAKVLKPIGDVGNAALKIPGVSPALKVLTAPIVMPVKWLMNLDNMFGEVGEYYGKQHMTSFMNQAGWIGKQVAKRDAAATVAAMDARSAYQALGLDPSKQHSSQSVKQAFKEIARTKHPDVVSGGIKLEAPRPPVDPGPGASASTRAQYQSQLKQFKEVLYPDYMKKMLEVSDFVNAQLAYKLLTKGSK